jgi:hypothetical protein
VPAATHQGVHQNQLKNPTTHSYFIRAALWFSGGMVMKYRPILSGLENPKNYRFAPGILA